MDLKQKEVIFTSKGNCWGVSQTFKVQGDRSGGITKMISLSRRSKDCMKA